MNNLNSSSNFNIFARFKNPELTAREYVDLCKRLVQAIQAGMPDLFSEEIYAWGYNTKTSGYLQKDWSNFDEIAFRQINYTEIAYQNPDPKNKKLTWESRSHLGFSSSYSNTKSKKRRIEISISAGDCQFQGLNRRQLGVINFLFAEDMQEIINRELFIQTLNILTQVVKIDYAKLSSYEFGQQAKMQRGDTDNRPWMMNVEVGWINYFANPSLYDLLPSKVGKTYLDNHGVVYWLSEQRPQMHNDRYDEQLISTALEIDSLIREHQLI